MNRRNGAVSETARSGGAVSFRQGIPIPETFLPKLILGRGIRWPSPMKRTAPSADARISKPQVRVCQQGTRDTISLSASAKGLG